MQTVARIRVRYAETDAMGIVYHTNYLVWFEIARTELFRSCGLPYTNFEANGLALAVVEANARYRAAAKYDDEIELRAELDEFGPRKVRFKYEITREGLLLCEGYTTHVFVNREGKAVSAALNPLWSEVRERLSSDV